MTIHAATDARRESARGNGVAHAGQFGHQAHNAPADFADPAAELESRQAEIAGRLDEAMTSAHGPTFESLRGVVETGEDGVPRLRVTETTVATRWRGTPSLTRASLSVSASTTSKVRSGSSTPTASVRWAAPRTSRCSSSAVTKRVR